MLAILAQLVRDRLSVVLFGSSPHDYRSHREPVSLAVAHLRVQLNTLL